MQILINTDNHVKGGDSANAQIESIVEAAVEHFATRITRVEVHLSDTNGPKHGDKAKRAVLEARVGGVRPIAVSHEAPRMLEAIEGAADKLTRALDHTLSRLDETASKAPRDLDVAGIEALEDLERGKH